MKTPLATRRNMLKGLSGLLGLLGLTTLVKAQTHQGHPENTTTPHSKHTGDNNRMLGTVNHQENGFDPMLMLVDFDYGKVSTLPSGQTLREYTIYAQDKEIEIAPGVKFAAWTYNGRVPGPSFRCTEGDRLRIKFVNTSSHPHTIHFHGIHPAEMDGTILNAPEIQPGGSFTYEFDAEPFGCHLYHCHALPLKRHIHKGLYGAFIVDPKEGRPPAKELIMVMNAFDTNFDNANDIYAVNTVAFAYANTPIPLMVGERVRIYLINILEFDFINSFHLHANMFDYYDHGTTLTPTSKTVDTISQVQGQRGILEFSYRFPGQYMFHPHISEFTELGWMGHFNVVKKEDYEEALKNSGVDMTWHQKSMQGKGGKS
ncbi:multicopper oxidase domain-containing protein [Deinococcus cellulosilyticus]|uniref:Copper-containing nitrite reductase n=1 Tax=Deinococcus cellulosilyticus (strain DSM 18568 / NBRC 106333 / KACC 11606 / 5516J-15) TaxID=1223518 RepID=A0A511N1J0_DEIC1|nr:multicopper oxidase domain-containing protein [Deinococcus cellulosilyticus]GEM46659.1 copper oxidase [Deinococcus cellulosilyticus NBRC 106333 = KACC 11606]